MNNDSNSEIAALRTQLFTLLVALIIVSGTVTVYLYRQASILRKDIDTIKPQAQQIITAFEQNKSLMANFVNQLAVYGQAHPDFRPVLLKSGINVQPPAAAVPAAPKK
ncbi:MAG: hypothetical protein WCH99_00945 [Verrucomicrobiota bacterium]